MFSAKQQESHPLYYNKITCKRLSDGELLFVCGDSRHLSAAFLHPFLYLSQAMCQNLGDLHVTGPLKDMNFSIPEGGGVRFIYQFTSEPPAVSFRATGEKDGIIDIVPRTGILFLNGSLDRETKAVHRLQVESLDEKGNTVKGPYTVTIYVEDINDNPPEFDQIKYTGVVRQNSRPGSNIGTLTAKDMDEENTLNSRLRFKIGSQVPAVPASNLFFIQQDTGILQLTSRSLNKRIASNYSLKVLVSDEVFQTICDVQVHVIDINDQIPIFEKSDYYNVTVAESLPVGTVILEIQATDGDEPGTGSSYIIYQMKEGDPNNTFIIDTDSETNRGFVKVNKALDFEATPVYNLVISATNPEPLVLGVQYNSSSLTLFKVFVTNVDEPPVFHKMVYKGEVSEDIPVNTLVMTVEAYDPEGDTVRYSLKGDVRKWLRIDSTTGQIYTASTLDREQEETYTVEVVASELTQKSKTTFILHLRDVNDNPPLLAMDYPPFFCHPLSGGERAFIQADDADEQWWYSTFTFSLADDMNTRNNWEISKVNATHAYLSPKHANFEEKVYNVPVIINDNGKPPLERKVNLEGILYLMVVYHDYIS
uniref:Cadherin 17 n=1 Tax=Strix occidentalis caurina TaxID=311401 RepID=A0A8D0EPK2_STROC